LVPLAVAHHVFECLEAARGGGAGTRDGQLRVYLMVRMGEEKEKGVEGFVDGQNLTREQIKELLQKQEQQKQQQKQTKG
jgi:hypothetical protein